MNLIEKAKRIKKLWDKAIHSLELGDHTRWESACQGLSNEFAQAVIEAEEIVRKLKHDVHAQRTVLDVKKPYKSEDKAQVWLDKYGK